MAIEVVDRTLVASIRNQREVQSDLDALGFAASKLWNVGRWTCDRVWSETGLIPEEGDLKSYLKTHERYADLHSQSSQRVLEELAEAFDGWYEKRRNGDSKANPPGYRKHNDEHPRSTVTFKQNGFKVDTKFGRVRLSKGKNLKEHWSDFARATRLNAKKSSRRIHYFHALSKHIVERCVEENVGLIAIGDLGGIREDEDGDVKDWGKHGNLDLHSWAFDRFTKMLEYKAEAEGITVKRVSERDTSKSCSCCGRKRKANRVERGLYVCDECGMVANADVNGAENIRRKVTPSLATDGGDRSNGWLAQPSTFVFDTESGCFAPREHVGS